MVDPGDRYIFFCFVPPFNNSVYYFKSKLANLLAMLQLQEKFKSVVDRMADLTDEKQQLEHLVMQLQSETETIGECSLLFIFAVKCVANRYVMTESRYYFAEEYVALYQKQRSVLQQRARETDFKMERVSQEKERLLNIIRSILTTDEFDCSFVKRLGNIFYSLEWNFVTIIIFYYLSRISNDIFR